MPYLYAIIRELRQRVRTRPDEGYSAETTVVVALLTAAAIVVVGIIVAKVVAKARSIDLG